MTLIRRKFLTTAALSGGVLSAPSLVQAQSKGTFNWKMTSAYPKGSPFYFDGPGSATDLAKRIKEMSDGRLNIQVFGAGELIPAFEGFDAVRAGTVEMNHANSYFWTGKTFAAQYFTAVPFGMNFQGMNGWLYDGGGIDLWNEVYAPFGMVAMPCGNTGVQMTGWFKKEIKTVADLKGLKMRIPGLAGKVYANLGVDVKVLPGGEIFPALERGVIDAAEFVGPFQDRRLGLHKAAKYYYTTGWHESATVSELLINKAAWQTLPKDLQAIVQNAAAACNVISEAWCQKANAEAMEDLIKNQKVIAKPLPEGVIKALRTETDKVLAEAVAKDPMTKKVHDSYMAFMAKYQRWADVSEGAYHSTVRG
ncbi:TRAP transporter substrate-binding protein [Rhodoferax sp.]|jgi:TRAP-type mannitol/chloroaromatic compound transport system substrate-binding protein|uniref:TRAP transporter substrate-binding protein n=1 Tax=Rhodoferax sp. TaxID=50421 RepID=UPI002734E561|nr:TRAP transporter substrate-binding protein DctP [Rhodoferax sp.]MDP3189928.1 TRAP transporter substrate-binding protein DctP [Rhodoferax sp.]MDP3338429.1 TRAP transporter substrate-binding protein DctP [Rhodoferax sp.]